MRSTHPVASYFTYALGNSLYVPLTSRCNAKTLPETRGPNFMLPSQVVSALCRVRDVEHGNQQWTHWCNYLDTTESKQKLPPALDPVAELPRGVPRLPTVDALVAEIMNRMENESFSSIVVGGEGEPTLRLEDLLAMSSELVTNERMQDLPPIRLTSNGLVAGDDVPAMLKRSGITEVSVALMTADPSQYVDLMEPRMEDAHNCVCCFIKKAHAVGLKVETTSVDRSDINREKLENLSQCLNVASPVRWREYYD